MDNAGVQDSRILSTWLDESPADRPARPAADSPFVFDGCDVGVILRAVLFVECAAAVVVMFDVQRAGEWVSRFSLVTVGALPGTLGWLLSACALKRVLARHSAAWQWAAGIGLGAAAGAFGCMHVWMVGLVHPSPWLASMTAGALIGAVLVGALMWRARARLPAATLARLGELQARIRPHFLFNTLNSAIALVRDDPARAERVLEDLSELFRHALSDPGGSATLEQEVEIAQRYLAIEQVRFGQRLRLQWDLDPDAGQARLPALLLQPLVENAVKHGVEPSSSGADVKISTERRGESVVVRITNTLPTGAEATRGNPGMGIALANVRQRLLLLHDVQARFSSGIMGDVFQVRLELPA